MELSQVKEASSNEFNQCLLINFEKEIESLKGQKKS